MDTAKPRFEADRTRYQNGSSHNTGVLPEAAKEKAQQAAASAKQQIEERPGQAVLTSVVAGAAVGVAVGLLLSRSPNARIAVKDRLAAEGVGEKLMANIEKALPDVLTRLVGSK